ncbi:DNA oxidative demethylase AlkB [Chitinimonas viridis]|uniref:DNA oxidative demethylase AlkB n=1 Tax=Chitinimonas viridis TaxID=664880 RepID=A0ABT8B6F9_9NEIS|nr:DNA oxidative demethylase AlkB [Chitinimonas viridis]MDN3577109.1 DNA oxidative demethylase AlkB [Chitinimonas viridis]
MTPDLFADQPAIWQEQLIPGAVVLRSQALMQADSLLATVAQLLVAAPLRHMLTPGGQTMSVAMSNCGHLGWISDRHGYRYSAQDPTSDQPWPAMPPSLQQLAAQAADLAGFAGFEPDACLINRYLAGTRLSLHQDKDERDFTQPIVSVSLGLPATFLFGGARRTDPILRIPLSHGDIVVWGGPARRHYHGVAPLKAGLHPVLGEQRINLTLRKAG